MTRRQWHIAVLAIVLSPVFKAVEFVAFPGGSRPDLLLLLVISASLTCDMWDSIPLGFLIGLLEDLVAKRLLGVRAISLAIAAGTVSLGSTALGPDTAVSKLALAFAASITGDAAAFLVLRGLGLPFSMSYFRTVLMETLFWSVILVIPVNAIMAKLARFVSNILPGKTHREGGLWA